MEFIAKKFSSIYFYWVDRRIDPGSSYQLNQKRLYIFPSLKGFLFILLIAIIWIMGTNYQNNLILGLSFFLLSIFLVTIIRTYTNMSGLEIGYQSHNHVYAGEHAKINFYLYVKNKEAESISLAWQGEKFLSSRDAVPANEHHYYDTAVETKKRGYLRLPRLLIQSDFPFGIIRCWSWLNFNNRIIVYPKPVEALQKQSMVTDEVNSSNVKMSHGEDFAGLSTYKEGDSMQRIAWKQFARGQGLHTKDFEQSVSASMWLDYDTISGDTLEDKVSGLAYWAIQYDRANYEYGLQLPNLKIMPNVGDQHFHKVMEALALYY